MFRGSQKLLEYEDKIANIAYMFREADEHFSLDSEHKELLKNAGEIIGRIVSLLIFYHFTVPETEKEFRKCLENVRVRVEEEFKKLKEYFNYKDAQDFVEKKE